MKYNNENVRKILMKIEETPYGEKLTVAKLQEKLPDCSIEEVIAIVTMLNRERYIIVLGKPGYDDEDVLRDNKIGCLTERGYRNLDLIKDDETWNLMKEKISNFNDLSIFMILSIANKLNNKKQNELFDLPNEFYSDCNRW